jgi:hypothetical protein
MFRPAAPTSHRAEGLQHTKVVLLGRRRLRSMEWQKKTVATAARRPGGTRVLNGSLLAVYVLEREYGRGAIV